MDSFLNYGVFALISAFSWIAMFFAKKTGRVNLGSCFGIVYHLALAPVVYALSAPEWVKIAGYVWIYTDALIDVASINGLSENIVWSLRTGVHIPASIWIIGVSLNMMSIPLIVGVLLGILLALHSILGKYIPKDKFVLFILVLPLMTLWLCLIAYASIK